MCKNSVHCKKNEQPVVAPASVDFKFGDTTYRVGLDLEITPALASIPCSKCNKSTRKIQSGHGVTLSSDDQKVNVQNDIFGDDGQHSHSVEDAEFVSVITSADVNKIEDIVSMIEIDEEKDEDGIWLAIEKHAKKILIGHIVCDGCMYKDNHLGNLLEK